LGLLGVLQTVLGGLSDSKKPALDEREVAAVPVRLFEPEFLLESEAGVPEVACEEVLDPFVRDEQVVDHKALLLQDVLLDIEIEIDRQDGDPDRALGPEQRGALGEVVGRLEIPDHHPGRNRQLLELEGEPELPGKDEVDVGDGVPRLVYNFVVVQLFELDEPNIEVDLVEVAL
jgi:hypothetical protein